MVKIKVNINKPDPTKEEIRKHKDFERFSDRFEQYYRQDGIRKMLSGELKDRRKLIYLIIILLLALLFLLGDLKDGNSKPPDAPPANVEQVND